MQTAEAALTAATEALVSAGIPAGEARSEARQLFSAATGITREQLLMAPDRALSAEAAVRFASLVKRRCQREPLAYILGHRGFYGLDFDVSPAVLIPRPETELLVETALDSCRAIARPFVADIGTGSGCIAVAIAKNRLDCRVHATDISSEALVIAQRNLKRHELEDRVVCFQGDLLSPLPPDRQYDVIVSNPPYISPTEIAALEPEVRDFEPRAALGERSDALHFYRRLAIETGAYLKPDGTLAVEIGFGQASAIEAIFREAGWRSVHVLPDLAGIPRVLALLFSHF